MASVRISQFAGFMLGLCAAPFIWAETASAQAPDLNFQNRIEALSRSTVLRTLKREVRLPVEPREPTLKLYLPFTTEYKSNAFSRNTDVVGDAVSTLSPYAVYSIPIGSGENTLNFHGEANTNRYFDSPSLDSDNLLPSVYFKRYANRAFRNKATKQYWTLKLANTTSFSRGFGTMTNSYLTPSVTLTRKYIPLGHRDCGKPGAGLPCNYLNLSGQIERSWAARSSQSSDRTVGTIAFVLAKRIPSRHLTLELTGSVEGQFYDRFPGGRDDVEFVGGGEISWERGNIEVTGSLSYTKLLSTVADAEWSGYSVTPEVKLTYVFGGRRNQRRK